MFMNLKNFVCALSITGYVFIFTSCKPRDVLIQVPEKTAKDTRFSVPSASKGQTSSRIMLMSDQKQVGLRLNDTGPHLSYGGGSVLANVEVIPVFWGPSVSIETTSKIPKFFETLTANNMFDWLSEYNTDIFRGTNQLIGYGTVKTAMTIAPFNRSMIVDDTDIQGELRQQIAAGNLPPPNGNTVYMTYMPPGLSFKTGDFTSCVQMCGYHGASYSSSSSFYYGVMADLSDNGCKGACGASPNAFDNLTSVSSHELIESVTDPDVGLGTGAWSDPNSRYGEIGDLCNGQQDVIYAADGIPYTVQKEWSNFASACIVNRAVAPSTKPPNVQKLRISNISSGRLVYLWQTGGLSTTGFVVAYSPGDDAPPNCFHGQDVKNKTTLAVTNLKLKTTYSARVCAYDKDGHLSSGVTIKGSTKSFPRPPTAKFTANGATSITVNVGDEVTYAWSSTNAASVSSTQVSINGSSACGEAPGVSPWIAHSHQGKKTIKIPSCQAQNTYLYSLSVDNGGGLSTGASVMVSVNPVAAATAVLTVNGSSGPLTVNVGDELHFDWSSTGGVKANSTVAADKPDSCGTATTGKSWRIANLIGRLIYKIPNCASGHTYKYTYVVANASGEQTTAMVHVTVQ